MGRDWGCPDCKHKPMRKKGGELICDNCLGYFVNVSESKDTNHKRYRYE